MKKLLSSMIVLVTIGFTIGLANLQAAEKEVWYNAEGEAVIYTAAEKKKERYVPRWEKRELERKARAAKRSAGKSTRSGVRYFVPFQAFPSNFTPSYYRNYGYGYGACWHGTRGYYSPQYRGTRFSASYRGNGWSVRINR